jgi:hypothetical protein
MRDGAGDTARGPARGASTGWVDHLETSDSIFSLELAPCPACQRSHRVTLSRIGWFAFRCGRTEMTGQVDHWIRTRRTWESSHAGPVVGAYPR